VRLSMKLLVGILLLLVGFLGMIFDAQNVHGIGPLLWIAGVILVSIDLDERGITK
jgi:hypothetical protein